MKKQESDLLLKVSNHLFDGSLTKKDLKGFMRLVDEGDEEAAFIFLKAKKILNLDDEGTLDENGEHSDLFIDLLDSSIRLHSNLRNIIAGGEDNYTFISKNICGILYHLVATSFKEYSLIELFAFALCLDLKTYIDDGDFDYSTIATKVGHLFKSGSLLLDDAEYFLKGYIDLEKPKFEDCVLVLCMLGMALAFKVDNPDLGEEEIVDSICEKSVSLTDSIKEWFENEDTFKPQEELRAYVVNEIGNDEMISEVTSKDIKSALKEEKVSNLLDHSFIDYSRDVLGDGFTLEAISVFCKGNDKYIDHKQEHDEYMAYLSNKRLEVSAFLEEAIPEISSSYIKEAEASGDPDTLSVVGTCYLFGSHIERDFEKAYECFSNASDRGHPEATYQLSVMFLKSLFVSFDVDKWLHYLALACKLGNTNAADQWRVFRESIYSFSGKAVSFQADRFESLYRKQNSSENQGKIFEKNR